MTAPIGITYTITNITNGIVSGEGFVGLRPNNSVTNVPYLSTDAINALTANLITATPSVVELAPAAGTASASGTIADVGTTFSQTTLNNNFATISAVVNAVYEMAELAQKNVLANRSKLNM